MVMQNISHRYSPTFRFSWAFSNGVYFHIFQGGFLFSILLYVIQTKWYSASRSVSFRANFNSVIDNSVNLSSAAANVYLYGSGFCWSYLRTVLSWEATIKKCPFIFITWRFQSWWDCRLQFAVLLESSFVDVFILFVCIYFKGASFDDCFHCVCFFVNLLTKEEFNFGSFFRFFT